MGNGVMAIGPQLPRPSSTLPEQTIDAVGGPSAARRKADAAPAGAGSQQLTQTGTHRDISESQTLKLYLAVRKHERKYKWSSASHRNHSPLRDLGRKETAGALRIIPGR